MAKMSPYEYDKMLDIENLIIQIEKRPCLWKHSDATYNDKFKKKESWDDVCENLYDIWSLFSPNEKEEAMSTVQKKWRSLKDYYRKEKKKQFKKRKYIFFDALTFLDINMESGDDANKNSNDETQASQDEIAPPIKFFAPPSDLPQHENSLADFEGGLPPERAAAPNKSKMSDFQDKLLNLLTKEKNCEDIDGDKYFLLSLVPEMKKLSDSQKLDFKTKTLNILRNMMISNRSNSGLLDVQLREFEQEMQGKEHNENSSLYYSPSSHSDNNSISRPESEEEIEIIKSEFV